MGMWVLLRHAGSMKQSPDFHQGLVESGREDTEEKISEHRRFRPKMFLYVIVKYRTIIKKLLKIEQENEMKTLILEFGNG
jgi:hypothetical protein